VERSHALCSSSNPKRLALLGRGIDPDAAPTPAPDIFYSMFRIAVKLRHEAQEAFLMSYPAKAEERRPAVLRDDVKRPSVAVHEVHQGPHTNSVARPPVEPDGTGSQVDAQLTIPPPDPCF
jgi:hypothetical protein